MNENLSAQLKQKRESLNLSLGDVSAATRIKVQYLQALEDGNLDALPSRVHARGFLRTYAEHLGIPPQSLLSLLDQQPETEQRVNKIPEAAPGNQTDTDDLSSSVNPSTTEEPSTPESDQSTNKDDPSDETSPQLSAPSREIYTRIGQKFKKQRSALGLKLEDVEEYTHLRLRHLEAIEEGNFNTLPSHVQARGMITNYARFLDLDTESVLLEFAEGVQAEFVEKTIATQSISKPARKAGKKALPIKFILTPDLMIGIGAILALVIFLAWSTSQIIAERQKELERDIPNISGILLENTEPPLAEEGTPTIETSFLPAASRTPVPASSLDVPAVNPTITLQALSNDPIQINIVAYQRAFLKVIVDGKVEYEGRVVPGNAYPFSARSSIELLTGDASALEVFFNQNNIGILGNTGEVARLIFSLEGMITPTPQFTPTNTSTLPPTLTPLPSPTQITPTITPFIP